MKALAVLLPGLLAASLAHADERYFLAGGEYADAAYYSYAGLIVPGPGRQNGRGFLQRYWVDAFGYEYDGAPGRVEARAVGAEAALGYGASIAGGWWTVSAGLRYTDTDLSPDDPSATARGGQLGGKFQFEGEAALDPQWRAGFIASYATRQNGYWSRFRLTRSVSPAFSGGVELVANGNDEADATAVGAVVGLRPPGSPWSVQLKTGYRFQADADGAYGGIEVGYAF
jgi:hypothetical protein